MNSEKRIITKIYRKKTIENINKKIKLLGINCKYNSIDLMNLRIILSVLILIISFVFLKNGFIFGPLIAILFYWASEYIILDYNIKKRSSKLDYDALFFFEVLSLTLESGRNLQGALSLTCENIKNDLSDEFSYAINEVKMGKSLTESLASMKERIPSETINTVLLNITQSNIFGNNILDSLNNQVDFLRERKLLETKGVINKLPIKLSIISVVIFIPLMLLLILSPLLIGLT